MKRRRSVVHPGRMELTRVSASGAFSRDRYEHAGILRNVLLSQEDEMSPVTVATTQGKDKGMVGGTFGERMDKCSVLSVSLKIELRRVREKMRRWLPL